MESNNLPNELKSLPVFPAQPDRKMRVAELKEAMRQNDRGVIRLIVQMCRLMKSDDLYKVAHYALSICKGMI
jgi:hypothetical protein